MRSRTFPEYPGHFPGEALVPGAVLLAWLQQELKAEGLSLKELSRVRFLLPVRPGESLGLSWTIDGDRLTFQLQASGMVARGVGRVQ